MPNALFHALRRPYFLIPSALLSIATVALCFVPLFNILGYEFCVTLSLLISIWVGIVIPLHLENSSPDRPFRTIGSSLLLGAIPLADALIIIMLNRIFVKNCDTAMGIRLFFLMPVVAMVFSTAIVLFLKSIKLPTILQILGFFLIFSGSIAFEILFALTQSLVFSYNGFFGWFKGPLYDEGLTLSLGFYAHRIVILLWSLLLSTAFVIRFSKKRWSTVTATPILLISIALGLLYTQGNKLGFFRTSAYIQRTLGGHIETPHFNIYYPVGRISAITLQQIANEHEFRYQQISTQLKWTQNRKIRSYIYMNAEQKYLLMGAKDVDITDPLTRDIHMNFNGLPLSNLHHELVHALAADFMSMRVPTGLIEGLAETLSEADSSASTHALTLDEWAKAMALLGYDISVSRYFSTVGFFGESGGRAYRLCGSFVGFLISHYGMELFQKLAMGRSFVDVYHASLPTMERIWKDYLKSVPLTSEKQRVAERVLKQRSAFEKPCVHTVANLHDAAETYTNIGNTDRALQTFGRICAYDPHDTAARFGKVRTWIKTERYTDASAELNALLTAPELSEAGKTAARFLQFKLAILTRDFTAAHAIGSPLLEDSLATYYRLDILLFLSLIASGDRQEELISYLKDDPAGQEEQLNSWVTATLPWASSKQCLLFGAKENSDAGIPACLDAWDDLQQSDPVISDQVGMTLYHLYYVSGQYPQALRALAKIQPLARSLANRHYIRDLVAKTQFMIDRHSGI